MTTVTFYQLESSDHIEILISVWFPSNSNPFHCTAFDYCCTEWDDLHDHSRDLPEEDVFKLSTFTAAAEFCGGPRLELMYTFLTIIIR